MGAANVTAVQVACSANSYTLGGTISGLVASGGLKIKNGSETLTFTSLDTSFVFTSPIAYGGTYAVTVDTQPIGFTCSLSNSSGTMGAANVSSVQINCNRNTYTVTASVTGLDSGQSLTLYYNNNIGGGTGSNTTTITSNGNTTVATGVPWSTYASTGMYTSPSNGQLCYATFNYVNKSYNGDSNSQVSSSITSDTIIYVVCRPVNSIANTTDVYANITGLTSGQSVRIYYNNNSGGGRGDVTASSNGYLLLSANVTYRSYISSSIISQPNNGQLCYAQVPSGQVSYSTDNNAYSNGYVAGDTFTVNIICSP
jgi:hypothetical protein